MIVGDLDIVSVAIAPHEANTELIIDPDAVLALSVAPQLFQPISGWRFEVIELNCSIDHRQFTECDIGGR
jgi:hypothetical protein